MDEETSKSLGETPTEHLQLPLNIDRSKKFGRLTTVSQKEG